MRVNKIATFALMAELARSCRGADRGLPLQREPPAQGRALRQPQPDDELVGRCKLPLSHCISLFN